MSFCEKVRSAVEVSSMNKTFMKRLAFPPHGPLVPSSAHDPCSRCETYKKELIAKDQLIVELQGKLEAIHNMSDSKTKFDQDGKGLSAAAEKTDSDSIDSISSLKEPAVKLQGLKSLGVGGAEVTFTVQEIINRVIDGSPIYKNDVNL